MNSVRVWIGALSLGLLFSFGACDATPESKKVAEMPSALAKPVAISDTFWIDVRTPSEYSEGHLPGAYNVPLQTFSKQFPSELPNKNAIVALYCRSGNRSAQALAQAQQMGYIRAFNAGGYAHLKQIRVSER